MALVIDLWCGEPEVKSWCPKCLLPSGIEVPIYSVSGQGVSQFATVHKCYDCGTPL